MLKKLDPETNKPTGFPVLDANFRLIYQGGIAIPDILTPEVVEQLGWCLYDVTQPPAVDRYQKAVEAEDVKDERGIWMQQWKIIEQTDVEKAATDAGQEGRMRALRTRLLYDSDWTQLADAQLSNEKKTEWTAYRQSLRDVSNQAGFPWEVTWPTLPSN